MLGQIINIALIQQTLAELWINTKEKLKQLSHTYSLNNHRMSSNPKSQQINGYHTHAVSLDPSSEP
jgi:hypothetical protein